MIVTVYSSAADRAADAEQIVRAQGAPRCPRPRSAKAWAALGPRAATERGQLQQWVSDLAAWLTLLHYHTHDSRYSAKGFPDSVFAGERTLFRELKTEWAALTPEQADWGRALLESGQDWAVWRPSDWFPSADWPQGFIRMELEAICCHAIPAGRRPRAVT